MGRFDRVRRRMVDEQLIPRGIEDERVLKAMRKLPRHLFVPEALREQSYGDHALPIGTRQTISQPYMVALMTEALALKGDEKVLEIGTGSGYQTAILAELAERVYSIERIEHLMEQAQQRLDALNYTNLILRLADGSCGWESCAPFDAILVTAGGPKIPQGLVGQLKVGGRLVIPVGTREVQTLRQIIKGNNSIRETSLASCLFVPLIGEAGWGSRDDKAKERQA